MPALKGRGVCQVYANRLGSDRGLLALRHRPELGKHSRRRLVAEAWHGSNPRAATAATATTSTTASAAGTPGVALRNLDEAAAVE